MAQFIKIVPLFLLTALAMIFSCELFHAKLSDAAYAEFPAIECNIDEMQFQSLKKDIEKNGFPCFFVANADNSELQHDLSVYVDDIDVKQALIKRTNLKSGVYHSYMNGITKITYYSIKDITYNNFCNNPSLLIGDESRQNEVYDQLKSKYAIKPPCIMQAEETDMVVIIWGLVAIFIVVINSSDIIRKKKEVLLKMVYGTDLLRLVIQMIVFDILSFEIVYFAARYLVSQFIDGAYKPLLGFAIYEIGCIIAAALNSLFFTMDIRGVLRNVLAGRRMLRLMHVLKGVTIAISVFTVVTNLWSLKEQTFGENPHIETLYQDGMFLRLKGSAMDLEDNKVSSDAIWNEWYHKEYDVVRPMISVKIIEDSTPVILVNSYGKQLLPSSLRDKTGNGVTVFYHKKCIEKEIIDAVLPQYAEGKNIKCQYQNYDQSVTVPYIHDDKMNSFQTSRNPIIVYCDETIRFDITLFCDTKDVIYQMSEDTLQQLSEKYNLKAKKIQTIHTNVAQFYKYQHSLWKRVLRFLTSLCIVVMFMNLCITYFICNLEYRIHGMEHALKRIHGYSIYGRNDRQFIQLNIISIISCLIVILLGALFHLYSVASCIFVSMAIVLLENLVMLGFVVKIEKQEIKKILKGGCL